MSALILPMLLLGSSVAYLDFDQGKSELVCRENANAPIDFKFIFEGNNKAMKMDVHPVIGGSWPKKGFHFEHPMHALQIIENEPIKAQDKLHFVITTGPFAHIPHIAKTAQYDIDFRMDTYLDQATKKPKLDRVRIAFYRGFDGYNQRTEALYKGECVEPESLSNDKGAAL